MSFWSQGEFLRKKSGFLKQKGGNYGGVLYILGVWGSGMYTKGGWGGRGSFGGGGVPFRKAGFFTKKAQFLKCNNF